MKKLIEKIDKKTKWIGYYYFEFVHAVGLFWSSIILSWLLTEIVIPNSKKYEPLFILIILISSLIVSNKMTLNKKFKIRMTLTAVILALFWIVILYII